MGDRDADRGRSLGGHPRGEQVGGDPRRRPGAHVEGERGARPRVAGPVGRPVAVAAASGGQHERVRHPPLRQRTPGRGGEAGHRGHARHHLDRHAGGARGGQLLARATEDGGVPGLQAHDAAAAARLGDDQGADAVLRPGVRAHGLADVDPLGVAARELEHAGIDEPVVEDHVRLLQPRHGAERQQVPRPRPRADEGDPPLGRAGRAVGQRRLQHGGGLALRAAAMRPPRGAVEGPGPERAPPLARDARGHRAAQAPGERRVGAEAGVEHLLDLRPDAAGQHRGRALRADGDDDRVAVHDGGRGDVAELRPVDDVDGGARRLGQRVQRRVEPGAPRRDERQRGAREGGGRDGPILVRDPPGGRKAGELGVERGREHGDPRVGLQEEAHLLRGLLAAAGDDDAAPGGAEEHREALHRGRSSGGEDAAAAAP